MQEFEVLVVGAGHAGIEAAVATAKMGLKTLLLTIDTKNIGLMSCNPAIGGVGKGQLVKEIDALGGQMARAADLCGIQFRILNASKGPAVQSSRAQIDMYMYNQYMVSLVKNIKNLFVKEDLADSLICDNSTVKGIATSKNEKIFSKTVIICPGTFLGGLIHIGLKNYPGGRHNEPASEGLLKNIENIGFNVLRFKTGTCPRLDKKTIDFSRLKVQDGDSIPKPFSFSTKKLSLKQVPCHITYTNKKTHEIILENLRYSPLYTGAIKSTGVRYCPSIEDKIVRFSDKERHQVFLEPQGLNCDEIYPNGLSTSLPEGAQLKILHSIEGLEKAEIKRFGYGIEHAVIDSRQLYPTLESKLIKNLYFAGQINGTTGYEEAAAQGLLAGVNAGLRIKGREPFILDRASSYIGVLIDDLVTKGTNEPYRMFTSRVEYRLLLREDNADLRLMKKGFDLGLISKKDYLKAEKKQKSISCGLRLLEGQFLKPSKQVNRCLLELGTTSINKPFSLKDLLKRPQVRLGDLLELDHIKLKPQNSILQSLEVEVKYSGFIQRQLKEVERFKNLEKIRLPQELDYSLINGLSREIREKLNSFRPLNLGQASRISGITPAAVSLLMIYLKKINEQK